jgi:predicted ATPase
VRWPLCGRAAEIDRLGERWARARDGLGGTAVIRGAAGSGRTRLAGEVAAFADAVRSLRAIWIDAGTRDD